ncbi:MAG: response regulator [Proteobacteria bacterium]|nr:response regulator [Pseudomonadota bacterium]
MTDARLRLDGVTALIVDGDKHAVGLMQQMLRGLGLESTTVVETGDRARNILKTTSFDLCLIEAELEDMNAADLVSEIRHMPPPAKHMPIIVVTSYAHMRNITRARDAGAHLVVKKPVSPKVLFDRIDWAASDSRPFVEASKYAGPDRRFKFAGPPDGVGRRDNDLSPEVGDATEPNMSQAEIDALIKPTRVMTE